MESRQSQVGEGSFFKQEFNGEASQCPGPNRLPDPYPAPGPLSRSTPGLLSRCGPLSRCDVKWVGYQPSHETAQSSQIAGPLRVPPCIAPKQAVQQRDGCLSLPYYLPNNPLQLRWQPLHLGGIAPADGQSVSRRRLRFISKNRAGSLPGKIRSPTSRQVPSLITAV